MLGRSWDRAGNLAERPREPRHRLLGREAARAQAGGDEEKRNLRVPDELAERTPGDDYRASLREDPLRTGRHEHRLGRSSREPLQRERRSREGATRVAASSGGFGPE